MASQTVNQSEPHVAVLGGRGQLGTELCKRLGCKGVCLDLPEMDVTDSVRVDNALKRFRFETVINCAAMTNVDACEHQPGQAFAVNALGALHVARTSRQIGASVVYVSSDYVFGGDAGHESPYDEQDSPDPINVYGCSKLAGENLTRHYNRDHYIVRTSGLYGHAGSRGKGGNFIETMLRLAEERRPIRVVNDQRLSPTHASELAKRILKLMETRCYGLYHIAAPDHCVWYEFACTIFEACGLDVTPEPITTEQYNAPADRPRCSALTGRHLTEVGIADCPGWREMLHHYLQESAMYKTQAAMS